MSDIKYINSSDSFAVMCESDLGVDEFKNPKGERMLFETIGKNLNFEAAKEQAVNLSSSGRYGKVVIVKLVVVEHIF